MKIRQFSLFVSLAGFACGVSAAPCDVVLACYNNQASATCTTYFGGPPPSYYSDPSQVVARYPSCFPGSSASAQAQVAGTSFQQVSAISSALSTRVLSTGGPSARAAIERRGMAAGNATQWNVWGSLLNNDTRQNFNVGADSRKIDSEILNSVFGADRAVAPNLVVGVSGGFDRGNSMDQGNNGSTSKGLSIAPYLGMQLGKDLALDLAVGAGTGKISVSGGTEAESRRLFYAGNLAYASWTGNMQLSGKLGWLHGEERFGDSKTGGATNSNTAAKSTIDQLRAGFQTGWWMDGVMPYLGLGYSGDVRRTSSLSGIDPIGRGAWVLSAGVNFFSLASGVTGGIAYNQEEGRSNQKNSNLAANISFRY